MMTSRCDGKATCRSHAARHGNVPSHAARPTDGRPWGVFTPCGPARGGHDETLKVGVQLPEVEYEPRWTALSAMARMAEDVGLDSVWVGDHYLYRDAVGARGPWEAWTQLAALAAVTSRVELGPLVAATAFHQPAVLAKLAATVDEISGGRLILGLGAGWNDVEFAAFGFPIEQRIARFEEAFTIIRTLLRDGRIDFAGRFYQARDCELLPRGPRPRVHPFSSARVVPACCASRCPGHSRGTPGT